MGNRNGVLAQKQQPIRLQGLEPVHLVGKIFVEPDAEFRFDLGFVNHAMTLNTAISFSTTTTWQAYAGENTMSYFSQMVAQP